MEVYAIMADNKKVSPVSGKKIISIDGSKRAKTSAEKNAEARLKLTESLKSGKILHGEVKGVERINNDVSVAVLHCNDYKVIIPASEMMDIQYSEDRDHQQQDQYLLSKRLGSEIDYVVINMDEEQEIALASRKKAMDAISKARYIDLDKDGQPCIYEGAVVESRIVCSTRAGVIVEVFGVETQIPSRELSYQRIQDATIDFPVGSIVIVKILSINIDENGKISIEASVKQAEPNPYIKAMKKYNEGDKYVGTVSMIDENGIFVALDGGVDALCPFPKRGPRPTRGTKVTIRITTKNEEMNRIFGSITYSSRIR